MLENLNVLNFKIDPDKTWFEVEYKGFLFVFHFEDNDHIQPLFARGADKTEIREHVEIYGELVEKYNRKTLHRMSSTIFSIGCLAHMPNDPNVGKDWIFNNTILNWLEDPVLFQEAKNYALQFCEWVYLVGNKKEGRYKIGMTTRKPTERIVEFSPKLPFEIEIFAECPEGRASRLENYLHKKFAEKNTNGEWFELSDGDVIYIRSMSI